MSDLEKMVETAKREMRQAEHNNDGLLILETADICIGKLWAEVEQLRAQRLQRQRTLSSALNALKESRAAENALFERVKVLEAALPDQAVLEAAAALLKYWSDPDQTVNRQPLYEAAAQLSAAAAKIREAHNG